MARIMTMAQALQEVKTYEKVFTIARLLSGKELHTLPKKENLKDTPGLCQQYYLENKETFCKDCVARKALLQKKDRTKIEFKNGEIYKVIAQYLEIDGEPYILELLLRLDEALSQDDPEYVRLARSLNAYTRKLYTDALTGVYNRRYFEEEVKKIRGVAGVAVIDMDDFKICNDTYGHSAGDAALATAVHVIQSCIRKTDIVVRYGGDEFVLILPEITRETLIRKLNEIQQKIRNTVLSDYSRLQISFSIGGVLAENENIEDAVKRADKMMYLAKHHKNTVVTQWDMENDTTALEKTPNSDRFKQQILIIDDSAMNRELLIDMLKDDYHILEASGGEEGIHILQQYGTGISLVLLDIIMPGMNGYEVLEYMNKRHWISDIPVIMISSETSGTAIRQAYELGAADFISRPFDVRVVYQRIFNMIKLYAKQRRLISMVTNQIYEKEKNSHILVDVLSQIVEFRNGESGLHVVHINRIVELLLERLTQKTDRYALDWSRQHLIVTASALHDIGKIGIDEQILNKPARLTSDEFETMKKHTLIGASILDGLETYRNEPLVREAYQICRWHHERYDGQGYPDGLKGDDIPISAQVVSLADVYDALTSRRVYKEAYSHEKAMEMILGGECGAFNPLLLECLQDVQDQLKEMFAEEKEANTLIGAQKKELVFR